MPEVLSLLRSFSSAYDTVTHLRPKKLFKGSHGNTWNQWQTDTERKHWKARGACLCRAFPVLGMVTRPSSCLLFLLDQDILGDCRLRPLQSCTTTMGEKTSIGEKTRTIYLLAASQAPYTSSVHQLHRRCRVSGSHHLRVKLDIYPALLPSNRPRSRVGCNTGWTNCRKMD